MIENDKEGHVIYRGGYKGDVFEGFNRYGSGCCYEYSNGIIHQIQLLKNGKKKGYQLLGKELLEYDDYNELVYEGGFEGSAEDGFVWSGEGKEYGGDGMIFFGQYSNGKRVKTVREIHKTKLIEYDDNDHIVYIGEYSQEDYKRSGKGQCFVYDGDNLKEVYHCENGEQTWKSMA